MSITEASVRAALESFVEPYLRQSLGQAGALRAVELHADRVVAKIELGFPTVGMLIPCNPLFNSIWRGLDFTSN
jgi:hypothetical protein